MKKSEIRTLQMEVLKLGQARQIGRSHNTFRTVLYRVGRCDGEVFIIIDGTEPSGGGTTTKKWIPLGRLCPLFERWEWEDAEVASNGDGYPVARFGKYFKPALPGNNSVSGRMVAVLRKEGVLVAGDMVTVLLPGYSTDFSFRKSVLNPFFGLDDVVDCYLELFDPVDVVTVPLDRVFNPGSMS